LTRRRDVAEVTAPARRIETATKSGKTGPGPVDKKRPAEEVNRSFSRCSSAERSSLIPVGSNLTSSFAPNGSAERPYSLRACAFVHWSAQGNPGLEIFRPGSFFNLTAFKSTEIDNLIVIS
jgi:hypothetical protein